MELKQSDVLGWEITSQQVLLLMESSSKIPF